MLLNIQCLRNKTNELTLFLRDYSMPDIVMLTEHWLKQDELIQMSDYVVLSSFCRTESIHGGCMILINEALLAQSPFQSVTKFNYLLQEFAFEFAMVFCKSQNLYIICIYRSPLSDSHVLLAGLDEILSNISSSAYIILTGDLNINFDERSSACTTHLSHLLESHNLQMHVKSPTRITRYSSSTIDYVCSNYCNEFISCTVENAALSDHEAVFLNVLKSKRQVKSSKRYGRVFSGRNYDRFYNVCASSCWESILETEDPISTFHTKIVGLFNNTFPITKIKPKKQSKKAWFTKGLTVSSKNLRSLHMIRKYTSSPNFNEYFAKYRSIFRRLIKLSKEQYYSNRLSNCQNSQKECWKIVNDIRQKNAHRPVSTPAASPDALNSFYCNIAGNLQQHLRPSVDPTEYLSNMGISKSFVFFPTDLIEIKSTLQSIKNKNSTGEDGLSAHIFLNLPDSALLVLVGAVNRSWETGTFSSCLSTAKVIPIHKEGSLDDPSNFRPISLLSTLSKIIEKLVKTRVLSFIDANDILNKCQFGFRENTGTNDAVYHLMHDLYSHINDGGVSAAVFCDLSKAFDCVSHEILLRKLHHYGFRGVTLSWFSSFLLGRRQRVFIGSNCSNYQPIDWGVPQGSVLGPVLFLLYINDLANLQIHGKFTIFADDTTIMWQAPDPVSLHEIILRDLQKVKVWCDSNLLTLNPTKTKLVCFKCSLADVSIDGAPVEIKPDSKFLGIFIDGDLKFHTHINSLAKKLSSGCFAVRTSVRELGPRIGRMVYYSLFESHLRYGIAFWGNANSYMLQMLFIIQKRAVRYICGANPRDSCRPLFLQERILTLPCLYILETACIIFKYQTRLEVRNPRYPSRNHRILRLPHPTSALTRRSIIYESVNIFNHLPLDIKNSASPRMFKRQMRTLLIAKAYYSTTEFFEDVL